MRKVYLKLTVAVILRADEGVDVGQWVENNPLTFEALCVAGSTVQARAKRSQELGSSVDVEDVNIEHVEITDSK